MGPARALRRAGPGLLVRPVRDPRRAGPRVQLLPRSATGGIDYTFTLDNYARALDPLFLDVMLFSLRTALLTTAIALFLGYAVAYFIATRPAR